MFLLKRFIFLFIVIFPVASFSCDLCGCFVPQDSMMKGFRIGIAEQYTSFSDLFLDGNQIPNVANQHMNSSYAQVLVNYHFDPQLALQASLPLIHRSFQRVEGGEIQRGTESGIGDLLLAGYFIPYQRKNPYSQFQWKILAGLKFPTGNSDRLGEELHEHDQALTESADTMVESGSGVHGHDLALGSGSWDSLIGTDLFGRSGRFFGAAHVQYAIRTRGDFDYRYANDLVWYGGPGYYVSTNEKVSVGIQAVLSGEYKGEDQIGNLATDDTAVTSVYLGPTALVGLKNIGMAEIGFAVPLSIANSGLQTVPGYRFRASLTWQFQ